MLVRTRLALCSFVAAVAACAGGGNTAAVPTSPSGNGVPDTGATGTPNLAYQFGAKFEPPAGRVVHGIGQWQEYNLTYAALLPADHQPASELIFVSLVDSLRPWNPANIAAAFAGIDARGRIPLADFAPRGGQPSPAEFALLPDPYWAVDNEVANGTKWDARIQDFAAVLKAFKKPVLLRIGGEMNGWWNGYHPYDFPRAYRKIVSMIRAVGASNVAFVWCYEPAGAGDFDEKNASGEYKWYPGADVVDWFSIDLYADVDISGATSGHGTLTPYGRTLKFLDMALAEHKPVAIAESGPQQFDLTQPAQAQAAWASWFTPYFALITNRAEIKWFTYVNYDWTKAAYYANQGWKNSDLSASPTISPLYLAELAKAKYLHAAGKSLLKDYALYK